MANCNFRCEGEFRMPVSRQQSIEQFSDPRSLDASVEEIFGTVLGWSCQQHPAPDPGQQETITAVVGLGGALSGACILRSSLADARAIVARMTGLESCEEDEIVQDGIGEMCNMLAGAWKGRHPELATACGLSVPAVITGHEYRLHVHTPRFQLHHSYRSGDLSFAVTIVCDGLE
jgi:chemotaxis protein CheX